MSELNNFAPTMPTSSRDFVHSTRVLSASPIISVSGFSSSTNSPFECRNPRVFAFANPRLSLLWMYCTSGYSRQTASAPSNDALSTTIVSNASSFVCTKIDARHFRRNAAERQFTMMIESCGVADIVKPRLEISRRNELPMPQFERQQKIDVPASLFLLAFMIGQHFTDEFLVEILGGGGIAAQQRFMHERLH